MSTIIASSDQKVATLAQLARAARDEYIAQVEAEKAARAALDAAETAAQAADAEWRGLLAALEATLARMPRNGRRPPDLSFALPFAFDDVAHYTIGSNPEFPTLREIVRNQLASGEREAA